MLQITKSDQWTKVIFLNVFINVFFYEGDIYYTFRMKMDSLHAKEKQSNAILP